MPLPKSREEPTKLLANLLNTVAGALIGVGFVAPIVAVIYGLAQKAVPVDRLVTEVVLCCFAAIVLD